MNKRTIIALGCDGYIGSALTQRLLVKGHKVIGIDDFTRRRIVKNEMLSKSATPIMFMSEKEKIFKELGDFEFHEFDFVEFPGYFDELVIRYHPDTIVNLAHIPSGPYSQISHETAHETLFNNYIGTNNILWSIKENCPNSHYLTIGTTGEYDHYSNIDIEEGYFAIKHKGRQSKEMMYPRRPGSIYHCSKVASTYLIDFLCKIWNLKCTDVQQSVVFGIYTDEVKNTKVYSRLDSDEAMGTVVNRFIVQGLLGVPLTIYGEGKHQRGFLSLNDSVQAMEIAIDNEPEPGKARVWNQLSEWHSMNDIATMVVNAFNDIGLTVETTHIESPRVEFTGDHYYHYVTDKLKALGYRPTRTIQEEIKYTINVLEKESLEHLKSVVEPKIKWRR